MLTSNQGLTTVEGSIEPPLKISTHCGAIVRGYPETNV